jgi:putative chitinase
VLYDAIPVIDEARAAELVPLIVPALAAAECTNPRRIAMYLAQYGHESGGFVYTEEIQKDGPGWTWDRKTYLGRTWCQITWQSNYAAFSQWCYARGLVDSPTYFVDNPGALADTKWAALGPAWWTVVKEPRLNEFADAGNIEDASKAINAPAWIGNPNLHANGIEDRTARYEQAIALGDALLTLTHETGDDDEMSGWTPELVDRAMVLLENLAGVVRPSRSRLRWPHQGTVDTCAGFAWNADGYGHEASVETSAVEDGHPVAIANLYAVINTDELGRGDDIEMAKRILARVPKKYITSAGAVIQTWLDAETQYNIQPAT